MGAVREGHTGPGDDRAGRVGAPVLPPVLLMGGDTVALEQIDLVDPDSYVERVPFEWFDFLRREHPVSWHDEPPPNHGFWAVTLEELDEEQLRIRKTMLETDPPRHRELRNICNKRFSARAVGRYEDFIRDVARRVLDRALEQEEFDFVPEISRELPIRFLCAIFEVPQGDAPQLIEWGDALIGNQDPEYSAAVVDQVDTEEFKYLP